MAAGRVSYVVPAYNEEARLQGSLARIIGFAAQAPYDVEIVVVDDGSADRTAGVAAEAAAGLPAGVELRVERHAHNRGKGAAVRTGMLAATGEYVLYMDADLATPLEEIPRLLAELDAGVDVAAGTRIQESGSDMRGSQPAWRRIGGRIFTIARRRLLLSDIADTQCGFKAFRAPAARAIFSRQHIDRWSADAEQLFLANKLGLAIRQVPVSWHHVEGSKLQLGPAAALQELLDLLRIRWMHRGVKPEMTETA